MRAPLAPKRAEPDTNVYTLSCVATRSLLKKTHPGPDHCITLRPESKTPDLNILNFSDRYILAIPVYIKALRKYYIKLK